MKRNKQEVNLVKFGIKTFCFFFVIEQGPWNIHSFDKKKKKREFIFLIRNGPSRAKFGLQNVNLTLLFRVGPKKAYNNTSTMEGNLSDQSQMVTSYISKFRWL